MKHRPARQLLLVEHAPACRRDGIGASYGLKQNRLMIYQRKPSPLLPASTLTPSAKRCLSPAALGADAPGFGRKKRAVTISGSQNCRRFRTSSHDQGFRGHGERKTGASPFQHCHRCGYAPNAHQSSACETNQERKAKSKAAGSILPPAARFSYLKAVVIALYVLGETAAGPPNT